MRNEYTIKGGFTENTGSHVIGSLCLKDLKEWLTDFYCRGTFYVKNRRGTVEIKVRKELRHSFSPFFSGQLVHIYTARYVNSAPDASGFTTEKFSDIAKYLKSLGLTSGYTMVKFPCEVVETECDGIVDLDNACYTYDYGEWELKEDCYYCSTDEEWYHSDNDLIYVDGNYYLSDDPDLFWCERCEEYHIGEGYEVHTGWRSTETWCEDCRNNHASECDDCGEWWTDDEMHSIDHPDYRVCSNCYDNSYYYCERCGSNVHYEYWDSEEECCNDCANACDYVMSYHWHHKHSYANKGMLFMPKGKMIPLGTQKNIDTCGLELEVSKNTTEGLTETIDEINKFQSADNEFFYEHDGSLDCGGFEIITAVHTFSSLKDMKWKEILDTLKEHGYRSHDGGLCGLHIHIGRRYFGKTDEEQSKNIGKIYGFYNLFWNDIVKASRRERFTYCRHPYDEVSPSDLEREYNQFKHKFVKRLFTKAALKEGSHGLALNNCNSATFEFRLGRGTLVYESFMAWIDFTFTVAKNSRRLSHKSVFDCDKWLDGISKDTAMYLKSKGAFADSKVISELTTVPDVTDDDVASGIA